MIFGGRATRLINYVENELKSHPTVSFAPGHNGFPRLSLQDILYIGNKKPDGLLIVPIVLHKQVGFVIFSYNPAALWSEFIDVAQDIVPVAKWNHFRISAEHVREHICAEHGIVLESVPYSMMTNQQPSRQTSRKERP
jgi:hypothetical protein